MNSILNFIVYHTRALYGFRKCVMYYIYGAFWGLIDMVTKLLLY